MARSGLIGEPERAGGGSDGLHSAPALGGALGVLTDVSPKSFRLVLGVSRGPVKMPAKRDPGTERRRPITVVLVDDERLIRTALAQTLTSVGIELVGEAASTKDAIPVVVDLRPDVVLMDVKLPDSPGVHAIQRLSLLAPASRILILTRSEENRVVEAIVAGASGYILKTAPPKAIIAAVKATAAGEAVLSPQIAGKLLQRIRERDIPITSASQDAAGAIRAALTERELEIFERLASGKSNQAIAHELSLSTNTVHNHIASILAKLHLDNRIQAAVHAVRSGIS
jgi:DNA-binding NarL/FixJ family response regulator